MLHIRFMREYRVVIYSVVSQGNRNLVLKIKKLFLLVLNKKASVIKYQSSNKNALNSLGTRTMFLIYLIRNSNCKLTHPNTSSNWKISCIVDLAHWNSFQMLLFFTTKNIYLSIDIIWLFVELLSIWYIIYGIKNNEWSTTVSLMPNTLYSFM